MAWTAPHTYVVGETVDKALLDADIRDNLLFLSTHTHSGGAGDGSAELAGLDSITLDFITDPAAPGASKTILYAKATSLFMREGASGAATALSLATHSHP